MIEDTKKIEHTDDTEMGSCSCCGSHNIEIMTRVTGFFSKVNSWNRGKIGELKKRRDAIKANKAEIMGQH